MVSGYNHKQKVFLEKILDDLFKFKIDEKRFEILKEQYIRSLKNFNAEQPYQQAIFYLALILTEQAWLKQELIDATECTLKFKKKMRNNFFFIFAVVTVDRLKTFVDDVLSRMHAECFIYGNVNREKAIELTSLIEQKLKKTNAHILPLLARQLLLKREYKLDGKQYLFETNNEFHKSSCSSLYFQCGAQDDRSNVMVDLITQILSEPCYNALRTKEQLGYIVFCGARKANGANGIRFIVQSTKHPEFVEERIEAFLSSMAVSTIMYSNVFILNVIYSNKKNEGSTYCYVRR